MFSVTTVSSAACVIIEVLFRAIDAEPNSVVVPMMPFFNFGCLLRERKISFSQIC
ncbi:hypothetical protein RV10_GL004702 [Enterococcus pallens]|nr:hypothetical protein RV10_GL004702 [Enterococcus pallens]